MKKTLRLLVTTKCHKKCSYCVNNQYDLDSLPVVEISDYNCNQLIITGGEPMIVVKPLTRILNDIRGLINDKIQIIIYSANLSAFITDTFETYGNGILSNIHGITLSIHDEIDLSNLYSNEAYLEDNSKDKYFGYLFNFQRLSLRLNVMNGIKVDKSKLFNNWTIKEDIIPLDNCPLPENETFKRLNTLL